MALVTTIRWRPYPEEKPPKAGTYFVRIGEKINARRYNISALGKKAEWFTQHVEGEAVTHFALPEDITTTESP